MEREHEMRPNRGDSGLSCRANGQMQGRDVRLDEVGRRRT